MTCQSTCPPSGVGGLQTWRHTGKQITLIQNSMLKVPNFLKLIFSQNWILSIYSYFLMEMVVVNYDDIVIIVFGGGFLGKVISYH